MEELALQVIHLIPVVRLVSRFFQRFKYCYVACILDCFYLIWFVCYYNLLTEYLEPCQTSKMGLFAKIFND